MTRDEDIAGYALPGVVIAAATVMHVFTPAFSVRGYVVDDDGKPLKYRLNGFGVLLLVEGLLAYDTFFLNGYYTLTLGEGYWGALAGANVAGLLCSAAYATVPPPIPDHRLRCSTVDRPKRGAPTADEECVVKARNSISVFFFGYQFNPRVNGWFNLGGAVQIDVKMWLYMVGAVLLRVNLATSFLAHVNERVQPGATFTPPAVTLLAGGLNTAAADASAFASGVISLLSLASLPALCYHGCMLWFIYEYMYNEAVHLYTYDLFAERIGFKLAWGCLVFYPFFYTSGAWCLTTPEGARAELNPVVCGLLVCLFFAGWILTRGANLQKYYLKVGIDSKKGRNGSRNKGGSATPKYVFFGLVPQRTVGGKGRLLVSGFWGVSRHVNYLGEVLQALALSMIPALATGSFVPLLYPLYYVLLFIGRQRDDDDICRRKYGDDWVAYVSAVPYCIIPGIY